MERFGGLAEQVSDAVGQDPWYREKPVYVFLESFVLSVMHELPPSRGERLAEMNLPEVFGTRARDWKGVIREVLDLSETIDIAILNGWYRLLETQGRLGEESDPEAYARDFVERFFDENSDVDAWTPDTLEEARHRIERIHSRET